MRDAFAGDQSQLKFTTAAPHQQLEPSVGEWGFFPVSAFRNNDKGKLPRGSESWIMLLSPLKVFILFPLVDKQLVHLIMIP